MALGETLRKARTERGYTASEVAAATRMKVQIVEALEDEDFSQIAAPIYAKGFLKLYAEHVGLDPYPLVHEYVTRFVGQAKTPSLDASDEKGTFVDEPEPTPAPEPVPARAPAPKPAAPRMESDRDDLFSAPRIARAPSAGTTPPASLEIIPPLTAASIDSEKVQDPVAAEEPEPEESAPEETALGRVSRGVGRIRPSDSPVKFWSIVAGCVVVLVFVISGLSRCVRRPEREVLPLIETGGQSLDVDIEPPSPYFD